MFKLIDENVSKNAHFTEDELVVFNSFLVLKKLPRRHFLIKPGEICNFEFFIVNGCIRKYFIDAHGVEVTLQLAIEDYWVGDFESYDHQVPSRIYIETLEPCTVLELSMPAKEKLLREMPKFERIFRLMLQNHVSKFQERLISTISKSAKEKYLDFMDKHPSLINRVPQHYIASYLGISPEFLSKVRKKLSTQHRIS
jgi:CRP/FNR family transcriptional regulator, cyclic AMP receptor protein